jgi:O-antigen/teichoic acid export membrane protein
MTDHSDEAKKEGAGIMMRGWITLIGAVGGALLVFGNEILVARIMGVQSYGLYALSLVVARMAETVSVFGLTTGMMHFLPAYLKEGRIPQVTGTIVASLLLPLILGLASALFVWTAAPWIATSILDVPAAAPYLRLFALPIPLLCTIEVLGVITRGFGRAEYYVLIRNITPPVIYMSLLALLFATDGSPMMVARAFGTAQLVACLIGIMVVTRFVGRHIRWERPQPPFVELYAYSFPLMLNSLLYTLMGAADIFMLTNMKGATEAGVYRACIQFRPAFDIALIAFNAAAIHLYPVLFREGRLAELNETYGTVIRITSGVAATLFVLVILSPVDILAMLGPDFQVGAATMRYLALGLLFHGCVGSAGILLIVTKHQRHETINAILGVVVNILINLVLIPPMGTAGAAVATAIGLFVMNFKRVMDVKRLIKVDSLRASSLRCLAIGLVAGLLVWVVARTCGFADGSGFFSMVARSALAGSLMLFGFWKFGPRENT